MKRRYLYIMGAALLLQSNVLYAQVVDVGASPAAVPVPSMFLSAEEVAGLRSAVAAFRRIAAGASSGDDDFLKKLEALAKPKDTDTRFIYPQFFLSSILFHSQKDWALWINGIKISLLDKYNPLGLEVLDISEKRVVLRWRPLQPERVVFVESEGVSVDKIAKTVTFTLHGNQTFSSYAMRVVEGRIAPVVIDNTTGVPLNPADATISKAAAAIKKTNNKQDDKTGLNGLIGAYQAIGKDKNQGE